MDAAVLHIEISFSCITRIQAEPKILKIQSRDAVWL